MPKLTASKSDIFSLGKSGEFDGFVQGSFSTELGAQYNSSIEFCHGIDANLSAEAFANFIGDLGTAAVLLEAEAKASAAAALDLELKVSPNVFKEFGVSMEARAYAEAAIAGRLAISLQAGVIAEAIIKEAGAGSTLGAEIAQAFVRQIDVEAGVWAKAMAGASAQAFAYVRGNLSGEKPGFDIGFGAGAAFKVGKGAEMYARVGFDDLDEFFDDSANILTQYISDKVGHKLPKRTQPIALYITRVSLRSAFTIGREIAGDHGRGNSNKKDVSKRINALFLQELRTSIDGIFSKAADYLEEQLTSIIPFDIFEELLALDETERAEFFAEARKTARFLKGETSRDPTEIAQQIDIFVQKVSLLSPTLGKHITSSISMLWCCLTLSGQNMEVAPVCVRRHVNNSNTIRSVGELSMAEALQWALLGEGRELLFKVFPELHVFEDLLKPHFEAIGLELWPTVYGLSAEPSQTLQNKIAPALIGAVSGALEKLYDSHIQPALAEHARSNAEFRPYWNEVLDPCLTVIPNVLDLMAREGITDSGFSDGLEESTQHALSLLSFRLVGGHISVLSKTLINHMIDDCGDAMRGYAREVKSGKHDRQFEKIILMLFPILGQRLKGKALRHLTGELLDLGGHAFGPAIWSRQRRARLENGIDGIVNALSFKDRESFEQRLVEMDNCNHIFALNELRAGQVVLSEIMSDEINLLAQRLPKILLETSEIATEEATKAFIAAAVDAVQDIVERAKEAREDLSRLRRELATLQRRIDSLEKRVERQIDALTDTVIARLKQGIKDVRSRGVAEARAQAGRVYDRLPRIARKQLSRLGWGKAKVQNTVGSAANKLLPSVPGAPINRQTVRNHVASLVNSNRIQSMRPQGLFPNGPLNSYFAGKGMTNGMSISVKFPIIGKKTFSLMNTTTRNNIVSNALQHNIVNQKLQELKDVVQDLRNLRSSLPEKIRLIDRAENLLERAENLIDRVGANGRLALSVQQPCDVSISTREGFTYGNSVPIDLSIRGARTSFFDGTTPPRIKISLNGKSIRLQDLRITRTEMGLDVSGWLGDNEKIVNGMNTLTILVTDGRARNPQTIHRQIIFAAQPDHFAATPLRFRGVRKRYDDTDRHLFASVSTPIILQNRGQRSVDVSNWKLIDAFGKEFVFENVRIPSKGQVVLMPGKGRDSKQGKTVTLHRNIRISNSRNGRKPLLLLDKKNVLQLRHGKI